MNNTAELLADYFAGDTIDELKLAAVDYGFDCKATPKDDQPCEGETVYDVDLPDTPTMQRIIATRIDYVARKGLSRLIERAKDGEPEALQMMLDRNMIYIPPRVASDARKVGKWIDNPWTGAELTPQA